MSNHSKLIIDTELMTNKASFNKILQDVKELNDEISTMIDLEYDLKMNIEYNPNQTKNIQNSINNMNTNLKLELQLDKRSLLAVEHEIQRLKTSIDVNVNTSPSKENSSTPMNILDQMNSFFDNFESMQSSYQNFTNYVDSVSSFNVGSINNVISKVVKNLGKLSLVTAGLFVAFEGIPWIVNKYKEAQERETRRNATRHEGLVFNSTEEIDDFKLRFNRLKELQIKKLEDQYNSLPKDEFNEYVSLQNSLYRDGFNIDPDIAYAEYGYKDDPTNRHEKPKIAEVDFYDEESIKKLKERLVIQLDIDTSKIFDMFEEIQNYDLFSGLVNKISYSGAYDSTGFLSREIESSMNIIPTVYDGYNLLKEKQVKLDKENEKSKLTIESKEESLRLDSGYSNYWIDNFKEEYIKNRENRTEFLNEYDKKDVKDFADSFEIHLQGLDEYDKLSEDILKVSEYLGQQTLKLKELNSAYLVAASGINLMEGALKKLRSNVSHAENVLTLSSDSNKLEASKNLFSAMVKESEALKLQLYGVQQSMKEIEKARPNDDFSIEHLYNPNSELSEFEQAYKQDYENQFEIQEIYEANLVSLRQQIDAYEQLIVSSDKYRMAWESVNERIELSKSLQKELRDVSAEFQVSVERAPELSNLLGNQFNSSEYLISAGEQKRDTVLSVAEKAQKALITYGDDAEKLQEALNEINATMGSEFDTAFIQPLKSLIENDIRESIENTKESNETLSTTTTSLETVLSGFGSAFDNFITYLNSLNIDMNSLESNEVAEEIRTNEQRGSTGTAQEFSSAPWYSNNDKPDWLRITDNILGIESTPVNQSNLFGFSQSANPGYNSSSVDYYQFSQAPDFSNVNPKRDIQGDILRSFGNGYNVTAADLNKHLENGLKNTGSIFMEAAKTYDLDPAFLTAIAIHETGKGKTITTNNVGNIQAKKGSGEKWRSYENITEGIYDLARLIDETYRDLWGLTSVTEIGTTYSPPGDSADHNKINQYWVPRVNDYYNDITGANFGIPLKTIQDLYSQANLPQPKSKVEEALQDDEKAKNQLLEYTNTLPAYKTQTEITNLLKKAIEERLDYAEIAAQEPSRLSGLSIDSTIAKYNAIGNARKETVESITYINSLISGFHEQISDLQSSIIEAEKDNQPELVSAMKSEIDSIYSLITTLEKNTESLEEFDAKLKEREFSDPRQNADEAKNYIVQGLSKLDYIDKSGNTGGIDWYKGLQDVQDMFSQYLTMDKKLAVSQDIFDKTGFGYENLGKLKQIKFQDDVNLLFAQMEDINDKLSRFAEGTNDWHVILQDAVQTQERLLEMENLKTEMAKRWFEISGQGLDAYVNARAYTQSRDLSQSYSNLNDATDYYQDNYRSLDQNEELSNLQIINEMHSQMAAVMDDYRNAIVGAYKAGAISLDDYIEKLYDLRDLQTEAKEQSLTMFEGITSSMTDSLSGAISSAMKGSFEAPLDFAQNFKNSLADIVSSQFSNLLLNNSGLKNLMDEFSASISEAMTSGDVNESLNAFNFNDFNDQLDGVLTQVMPYIEQIAASTDGMFGIMKNEVYNAPEGFKIDEYLYDMAKGASYEDVAPWLGNQSGPTNEAGSPVGGNEDDDLITVDPLPKPSFNPRIVTKPIDPIRSTGRPEYGLPEENPVLDALNAIIHAKELYNADSSLTSSANALVHSSANDGRDLLERLGATDILKDIGDGINGMDLEELEAYVRDNEDKISQYNQEDYQYSDRDLKKAKDYISESGELEQKLQSVGRTKTNTEKKIKENPFGMSEKDFEKYYANKAKYNDASDKEKKKLNKENEALRKQYGIEKDEYNVQDLNSYMTGDSSDLSKIESNGHNSNVIMGSVDDKLGENNGLLSTLIGGVSDVVGAISSAFKTSSSSSSSSKSSSSKSSSSKSTTSKNTRSKSTTRKSSSKYQDADKDGRDDREYGNNGAGTDKEKKDNDNRLKKDSKFRETERERAEKVIKNRKRAGLDTKAQEDYLKKIDNYHSGGIAGLKKFTSGVGLLPNELNSILQHGEVILQPGQIQDMMQVGKYEGITNRLYTMGQPINSSTGLTGDNSEDINININIDGNGSVDEERLNRTVDSAVRKAILQARKADRFNNLQTRGVSY
ncbi:glucosaminidase domain-containing protein [Chengkuizengella axinellae]|uniref:Mannosyl-glycoprotein endo-beta-N-acetylglucosamidase-like domain-containing protein n=1 Tax=Chengkuizengella axinellae TaxID=3064388 RepID=A0ABT9IWH2_9BACL|nr:glucosaminidase domain-containing protein [Chengkuizengella sp. 2205SS18-9]MDP5273672.1 hypothetical protein [Chengkuizengella sp. 2205SS18-9]